MTRFFKRLSLVFAVLVILFVSSTTIHSSDQTVFGPQTCVIKTYNAYLFLDVLKVDGHQEGTIIITKNTPHKKIENGFILLDLQFISLHDFFEGNATVFEAEVDLHSLNLLTISFRGDNGASITVEIRKKAALPPPEITLTANPPSIGKGQTSTLTWTTKYAQSATIDNGIGTVALSGSQAVSPVVSTTYKLTATGPGGTSTANASVTIVNRPPVATPQSITTDENAPVAFVLTGTDPDGDALTYKIVAPPTHGTLTGVAPNLTYTPSPYYNGTDAFRNCQ